MKNRKDYPWMDKAAGKISSTLLKWQTKVSDMISRKLNKVSLKRLKILLIAFCLISGGYSGYLMISAVFFKTKPSIRIEQTKVPQHFDRTGDAIIDGRIDEDLFRTIQEYKKYMDSLRQPIRPGLLDSIRILEEIYYSQQKR